jgi:hypothetical protein
MEEETKNSECTGKATKFADDPLDNYLTTWPINRIIQLKHRKDVYKNEIRKKERMVRTILFSFFDTLSADKERDKYPPSFTSDTNYKTFWYNLVN